MKNGINFFLILVLLATIGLLVYFGLGNVNPAEPAASVDTIPATEVTPITETLIPTSVQTATLIPASVTIPTKTVTLTSRPTETATRTPTASPTATSSISTPASSLEQEINTGIERGNHIIQAIEAYHTAKGSYPPTLNELSPTYLKDIPMTSTGQAYFYRLFDASSPLTSNVYWVSFRAINQDHVSCIYFRAFDYWDCNYASP
jgi:hypothetical protein